MKFFWSWLANILICPNKNVFISFFFFKKTKYLQSDELCYSNPYNIIKKKNQEQRIVSVDYSSKQADRLVGALILETDV